MNRAAAIGGALAGVLLAVAAGWVLGPRLLPGAGRTSQEPARPSAPGLEAPVPVPIEAAERERQRLSEQRVPFYRELRAKWSHAIERFAVLDEQDTLLVVVTRSDDDAVRALVEQAIAPSARQYGFRRARLMTADPVSGAEPYRLIAEASCDDTGRWTVYPR